ncbi:MAG: uridine phosphorylase [Desulfurococcales archaeon]|jgi:uridine phosphorylase
MLSERPTVSGKQYHLSVGEGDVARYVLLPGDPERVPRIARTWDRYWHVASHREYVTYTGEYKGVKISATSTGIGGPSTAIAVEELLQVGADTFIRVGTTGSLRRDVGIGDLVISIASVRMDGASRAYIFPEYPAVASYEVVLALIEAAETLGARYVVGITASTDSFYVGQGRPGYRDYMPPWSKDLVKVLRDVNVINFEMEAATIFTLSNIYGARAGAICSVIANRETGELVPDAGVDLMIRIANEAVKILSEWDSLKEKSGKKYFYPSIVRRQQ